MELDLGPMAAEDARSFWIAEPCRGEIRTEALRAAEPGEAVVRTLYTGVSRGTEALVFAGAVPASERERMRAPFQVGDFPAPVKYGYNNVGIVESGPAALVGRHVFCLYPHQTRYVVPASALHVLPANVPPARAVLGANLETAVNGLWDLGARIGDRIAVVGAGTVGCLVAWLAARTAGAEIQLVDVDPRKRAVAAELGVAFALASDAARDVDLVVHSSGTEAGLELALELAGFESTVLELSWYGARRPAVPLGESFHSRRLTLKSSQVGSVAGPQRARWSTARRMQLALRLLAEPRLDALISGESAFEELPRVLARLASPSEYGLCHRIRYS
jgi:NADPH:quinone reductase-like Zn-dependent oxidoreductase